jgi:uridine kinase
LAERIVAAQYANNELLSINETPLSGGFIEPLYLDTPAGAKTQLRTFDFVLCMAANHVLTKHCLVIGQPIDDCNYWTYSDDTEPAAGELISLTEEMRRLIDAALTINVRHILAQEALDYFTRSGQTALVEYVKHCGKAGIKVNACDAPDGEYLDIYRDPLLPSTGLLTSFRLQKYHKGFILIPEGAKIETFTREIPPLLKLHDKYKDWGRICGVDSVPALNAIAASGGRAVQEFIRLCEVYSEKNFSDAARDIVDKRANARIIMLAGPSSSGKTTSAKRLCLHLQVLGLLPIVISLDDYYLHPDAVPRDEDGKPDFECLEALDVPYLNKQLLALLDGETVTLPKFDFKTGQRSAGKEIKLQPRSALVVEGIHALNDNLTPSVPRDAKYKLYVSALTQIKLDEHNRISASDNRLIRRIVRDNQFRGIPASRTLMMWHSVRRGELRHIFPFQNSADAIINSALEYELGVLRIYAEPLLRSVPASEKVHAEAARLLRILANFAAIPPQYISGISILREFIGNSEFKY